MKTLKVKPEGIGIAEEKMRELLEICQIYEIPMFVTIATNDSMEKGTRYSRMVYGAAAHRIELADDQIRKHILIANGFSAVPRRDHFSFERFKEMDNHED